MEISFHSKQINQKPLTIKYVPDKKAIILDSEKRSINQITGLLKNKKTKLARIKINLYLDSNFRVNYDLSIQETSKKLGCTKDNAKSNFLLSNGSELQNNFSILDEHKNFESDSRKKQKEIRINNEDHFIALQNGQLIQNKSCQNKSKLSKNKKIFDSNIFLINM